MKTAEMKDRVVVSYQGTTAEGVLFDSATEETPLTFELGSEEILPAFSAAICGMREGEAKEFVVEPENAFGERLEELVQRLDRKKFGNAMELKAGIVLALTMEKEGKQHKVPAMITAVDEEQVTIDYNHPLAGQPLHYQVSLLKIEKNG